jgi:hypothetical protein
MKHGGHVVSSVAPSASTTPFDYLLVDLKKKPSAHIPGDPAAVTAALKNLGKAMVDSANGGQIDPRPR